MSLSDFRIGDIVMIKGDSTHDIKSEVERTGHIVGLTTNVSVTSIIHCGISDSVIVIPLVKFVLDPNPRGVNPVHLIKVSK